MTLLWVVLFAQEATVRGTVEVGHRVPSPRTLRLDADPKVAAMHPQPPVDESLRVDVNGGLKWAFVYVKQGLEGRAFPIPESPVRIEFNRGFLTPRVVGIRVGQELLVRNKDNVLHNCHSLPTDERNREFNFGMPTAGTEERKSFAVPELMMVLKCDVHPHDRARISVLPHPFFAVTDEHGRYEIRGLPPGRYVVEVRHEKCLPVEREIEVTAGEVRALDFVVATEDGPPPRNWKPFLIGGGAMAGALAFLGILLARRPRVAPRP